MMIAVYSRWTLLQVLLSLVCITKLSCGFNAATTLPSSSPFVHVAPSVLTSKSFARYNRRGESLHRKCSLQLQAHHRDDSKTAQPVVVVVGYSHYSGSSLRSSGLFHQRQQHDMHTTSRLQMSTTPDDTNNDISSSSGSSNKNPLVRIWLKLRVFMARLWVSRSQHHHLDISHLI